MSHMQPGPVTGVPSGWSIDTHQASSLVTNALSMALTNRRPTAGTVIHSDHGTQFTCWSFTERVLTPVK